MIKAHAGKVPFLELRQTFVNAIEALAFLKTEPIDLIFLDINMPDLTGLDFAQVVENQSLVIFHDGLPRIHLAGTQRTRLPVKPIAFGRFVQASSKAFERLSGKNKNGAPVRAPYIFVKDGYD